MQNLDLHLNVTNFPTYVCVIDLYSGEQGVDGLESPSLANFFSRFDDSHCSRDHSTLKTDCSFDDGYTGMQPVAWKTIL